MRFCGFQLHHKTRLLTSVFLLWERGVFPLADAVWAEKAIWSRTPVHRFAARRRKSRTTYVSPHKTAVPSRAVILPRAPYGSPHLHHVLWIIMLSTAKTSENTLFSEVFCCFLGKNRTFTNLQNRFRFCAVFWPFFMQNRTWTLRFFADQILFRKFLKIATKFLTGEEHMIIMIIELSVIRLS